MMTKNLRLLPLWLSLATAVAFLPVAKTVRAQSTPGSPAPAKTTSAKPQQAAPAKAAAAEPTPSPAAATPLPDRAQSYYHLALAGIYEDEAVTQGSQEFATRAIEEYKLALNADPGSAEINSGLSELYFRTGHTREAEASVRELIKNSPENVDAHKLLGRIYLRQLGDGANPAASSSGNVLEQAIAEFEKIVAFEPKDAEDRMILGQLYSVKHDQKKAEEEFKIAQALEPASEEVVLNLARVYAEGGDLEHAAKVIEVVPVADRSAKMEFALGAAYDQLKRSKDAIAAYQRAVDLEPGDVRALGALAQSLLSDNQLDESLKYYKELAEADPEDATVLIHIGEILRRQGKYEAALNTIRKVHKLDQNTLEKGAKLEAGYNEGLLLDVLGRFDDAAEVYEKMVELTSHANGAYTTEEKSNRGIFLERLGAVYHEENKIDEAIAIYQKMIELGGETALRGFQGQVDAYRDAKQFDKAVDVSRKAVLANPKDRRLKLMLADELTDLGKSDEALGIAKGLLKNTDEDQEVWVSLGQMYVRMRRWKEAEDALNKAEAVTSKKEDRTYLYFLKGELADRQKHLEPAEQYFRQALELDPTSSMTLNYLGFMLADKGLRLPEALKLIRKAVDLEPMNGAYLDSLGWVYFKMGQYELAEQNLRKAVDRDQADPTVHDHLGDLYEKTGRIRLAATQWELSLTEFSKSAPADVEPAEVAKVQRKLENAHVKLAKRESATGQARPE
jgi:tetratricopeptide (TPR) repeat protein